MSGGTELIRRRALRLDQNPQHPLFLFALTGDELLNVADISRVARNEMGKLIGYQRPEVRRHVNNIVEYLDSGNVLFPNAIILALTKEVRFQEARGPKVDEGLATAGTLELPLPTNGGPRPAWIVDGQQRAMALSRAQRKDLPIPVSAFFAPDVAIQREQFLRVNSTRPLPRGLIAELLPEISTVLPPRLAARRIPSALCELLNTDPESPFRGIIRRASTTKAERSSACVADTSIITMLSDSMNTPSGCLFPYRNVATGETDFPAIRRLLFVYWNAVKATFPEAWGVSPQQSRLMHSAGIRAMGRLMDKVMAALDASRTDAPKRVERELALIKGECHWTSGAWEDLGGLRWNEIQNLPGHIKLLSNGLLRSYLRRRAGQ